MIKTRNDIAFKVGTVGVDKATKKANGYCRIMDFYGLMCDKMLSIASERETGDAKSKILIRSKIIASFELQFLLLSKYIDRPVVLPPLHNAHKESMSSHASFILYNYARINQLLCTFKRQQGVYGDLFVLENVDFCNLREPEEWDIVFNCVLPYQELMNSISKIRQFETKESKETLYKSLGHVCGLLLNLSNKYSRYYRRVRVLRVGTQVPEVIQTLNARLYLLLAIKAIYEHAFIILGIDTVDSM